MLDNTFLKFITQKKQEINLAFLYSDTFFIIY